MANESASDKSADSDDTADDAEAKPGVFRSAAFWIIIVVLCGGGATAAVLSRKKKGQS